MATPFIHLDGLLLLLCFVGPLLLLQRRLHYETQAIFLILTRRSEIAIVLFSLLFLPGVVLHEASHYLMAGVLRVRTGKFSIIPQPLPDGRLRMGYVETEPVDWLRDGLIGAAPLLLGGAFVAYAGLFRLGLLSVWKMWTGPGSETDVLLALSQVWNQPDFWLWFYLVFAVSSTMLPSSSDRRAWLPLALSLSILLAASLLAGAGPWLLTNLASPLNRAFQALAVVFAISVLTHLLLLLPVWLARRLLSQLFRLRVV